MSYLNTVTFVNAYDINNPVYIYRVLYYDPEKMIYHCNEYEFVGIRPDRDTRVYKHHRKILILAEDFLKMDIFTGYYEIS